MKFSQIMQFIVENNKHLKKIFLSAMGSVWVPMTPWGSRSNISTKVCDVVPK